MRVLKNSVQSILIASFLIIGLIISANHSFATTENSSSNKEQKDITVLEEQQLVDFFVKYGVDKETTDNLIQKIKKGILLDSVLEEYSDLEPQEVIKTEEGFCYKTIYPDGSIKISTMHGNDGEDLIMPTSVSPGNFSWGGAGQWWQHTGRVAKDFWGFATAQFSFDDCGHQGLQAKITRVYNYSISTIGCVYDKEFFGITKSTASGNSPAKAKLVFKLSGVNNVGSMTAYLQVNVLSRESAWTGM